MRMSSVLSMVLVLAPAIAGCGVTYPGDRPNWVLAATPNAEGEVVLQGSLELFEASDVSEGCRLLEGFTAEATVLEPERSLDILWEGSWTGDKEGVELELSCSSAAATNVELLDCATATLKLSCEVVGEKLDCGDYVFQ